MSRRHLLGFCESLKQGGLILIGAPNPDRFPASLPGIHRTGSMSGSTGIYVAKNRPDSRATRRFRPSSTRWSRCRNLENVRRAPTAFEIIYRKQYESPRYPEMRLRKPVFAACRYRGRRHQSSPAGEGRRPARRLSRDLAKALNDERNVVRGEGESQPSAGDAFARRIFRLRNEAPMVSFTFDDIPKSAATTGAGILEDHGARGTFYVSGGLVGTTSSPNWEAVEVADIIALHRRGHEIGCHTFSHRRACDLDAAAMAEEIEQNRRYLQSVDPSIKVENFAYPFGYGSFGRKQPAQGRVPVLPQHRAGREHRHRGPAIPPRDALDRQAHRPRRNQRALDETQNNNGWLIFYSHDVADAQSLWLFAGTPEPCP